MAVPILYFHGFASSPASAKITALRPLLEPEIELVTPDLNVPSFAELDLGAMVALGMREAERIAPRAIVGSSLGAIIALSVAREHPAPLVLIAPALGIADRWRTKVPDGDPISVFNHALGQHATIHRAFFLRMAEVDVDPQPPPAPVTAIMGRLDESVPFECVERTWREWEAAGLAPGSRLIEVPDGDHGLVKETARIAQLIRAAVGWRT